MSMESHQAYCRQKAFGHSDAAKRLCDQYNLHRSADPYNSVGKWFAVALNDGNSDGTLYDTKRDAITHQHHNEHWYCYIKIVPHTMHICDAEVMLSTYRQAYDHGMRLTDPDDKQGGKDLIKRSTTEDMLAMARWRSQNIIIPLL